MGTTLWSGRIRCRRSNPNCINTSLRRNSNGPTTRFCDPGEGHKATEAADIWHRISLCDILPYAKLRHPLVTDSVLRTIVLGSSEGTFNA